VRRGFAFTLEAFVVLALVVSIVSFYSFSSLDSKKGFYQMLLAEDFAEVSVKSNALEKIQANDVPWLSGFYLNAGKLSGVSCVKFGFVELSQAGNCTGAKRFFSSSRLVIVSGNWRVFRLTLGFD